MSWGWATGAWRLAALLAVSMAAASCGEGQAGGATAVEPTEAEALSVEVVQVARRPFKRTIEVSANVLPLSQVAVVPRVPGRVEEVLVDVGDRVEHNQVLIQLERRDYHLALRQAEASLAAARANGELAAIGVKSAETAKQRMASLRQSAAIAESEAEKADDGYRMGLAKQTAANAQAQLARVGLDSARSKLADTVIRAPFAGVVLKRMTDAGALASPMSQRPLLLLAEDRRMHVEGSVGERDLREVRAGMPATVHVDALAGDPLAGTVEIVSPMVDPRTRTAGVRVTLDNPEGRLGAGMSARIVLDLGSQEVLAAPDDAVARLGTGERGEVYVVERGRVARRREVTVGVRHGDLVEIAEGLREGDVLVRGGHATLADGQRVAVSRTDAEASE